MTSSYLESQYDSDELSPDEVELIRSKAFVRHENNTDAQLANHELKQKLGESWIEDILSDVNSNSNAYYAINTIAADYSYSDLLPLSKLLVDEHLTLPDSRGGRDELQSLFLGPTFLDNLHPDSVEVVDNFKLAVDILCTKASVTRNRQGLSSEFNLLQMDIFNYVKTLSIISTHVQGGSHRSEILDYLKTLPLANEDVFDNHLKGEIQRLSDTIIINEGLEDQSFSWRVLPDRDTYEQDYNNYENDDDETDNYDTEEEGENEFRSHGLIVSYYNQSSFGDEEQKAGNKTYMKESGERYLGVDFMPEGNTSFTGDVAKYLLYGYLAFKDFFHHIESHPELKITDTTVIEGTTNYRMAMASEKMGFHIIDSDVVSRDKILSSLGGRNGEGSILDMYSATVITTVSEVRKALKELESKKVRRIQGASGDVLYLDLLKRMARYREPA